MAPSEYWDEPYTQAAGLLAPTPAAGAGWMMVGRSTIVSRWPHAPRRDRADSERARVVNRMKDLLLGGSRSGPTAQEMQQLMVLTAYDFRAAESTAGIGSSTAFPLRYCCAACTIAAR